MELYCFLQISQVIFKIGENRKIYKEMGKTHTFTVKNCSFMVVRNLHKFLLVLQYIFVHLQNNICEYFQVYFWTSF